MKDGQKYTSYEKLDTLETRLIPEQFVRCHKSFIVNLFYVDKKRTAKYNQLLRIEEQLGVVAEYKNPFDKY